jgi:hypothetical protein
VLEADEVLVLEVSCGGECSVSFRWKAQERAEEAAGLGSREWLAHSAAEEYTGGKGGMAQVILDLID